MKSRISRRRFVQSAAISTASAVLLKGQPAFAKALGSLSAGAPDATGDASWKEAGVVDTSRSPFAKLRPVPVRAVEIHEGFWSKRRVTNVESSIPSMHDELIGHGRMDNFLRL